LKIAKEEGNRITTISRLFEFNMDSIMKRLIMEKWPTSRWNMERFPKGMSYIVTFYIVA
jgi:hypothetical protein